MVLGVQADGADPRAVVGRLAVQLARGGVAGLPVALADLVRDTGLHSAVLRAAGPSGSDRRGELLATAGEVVRAVPEGRYDIPAVVEMTVSTPDGSERAVLTVRGARPAVLPLLRDAATVLGLALAAVPSDGLAPGGRAVLRDAETDRAALADALHDGPMQDLVVARYAVDAALRAGSDLAVARDAVQSALVGLRRGLWQLRPRGRDDLAAALRALSERRVESGLPALTLRVDPGSDVLDPDAAVAAYRLVQAATGAGASGSGPVVGVRRPAGAARDLVVVTVEGAAPLADPDRWRRTAAALGGDLLCRPGRLRLALPVPLAAARRLPDAPAPHEHARPAPIPHAPALDAPAKATP